MRAVFDIIFDIFIKNQREYNTYHWHFQMMMGYEMLLNWEWGKGIQSGQKWTIWDLREKNIKVFMNKY